MDYSPGTNPHPQPVASTTEVDRDFEGASVPWETGREQRSFVHYGPGDNHTPAPRGPGVRFVSFGPDKPFPPVAPQMSAFLLSGALASGNGAAHSRQRWLPFHLLHLFDFFFPL